jgi:hypothetical protein
MNDVSGSIYLVRGPVLCKRCAADCTADFEYEVRSAASAVASAYGNGLAEAIAYLEKLEATILCKACARV